ncbi:Spore coat protein CotF [Domibacillus enclensis]|uniref:Spore coat protein CotF n=2 Tax=Domibacillus enclensis TaxID=1017273 RepID=A0A1N6NHI4_9BACI|nr:Spore coat protein CotF [Domibacillus enclensis]
MKQSKEAATAFRSAVRASHKRMNKIAFLPHTKRATHFIQEAMTVTSPQFNHGAHELFDVHEVLSTTLGALNKMTLVRDHIQDPELLDILDRQHAFMLQEYNTTVDCFQSGQDPAVPTKSYMMKQNNTFTFGIEPKAPSKPMQQASEINDEVISGFMLGAAKSIATAKTSAALETTNPVVRRVIADSIPNCIEMAYETSIYQNKHRYYQVPQLPVADMQMILQSYASAPQAVTQ